MREELATRASLPTAMDVSGGRGTGRHIVEYCSYVVEKGIRRASVAVRTSTHPSWDVRPLWFVGDHDCWSELERCFFSDLAVGRPLGPWAYANPVFESMTRFLNRGHR